MLKSERFPGEGNGSCLENPMDGGVWWPTVHGVTRVRHDLATKPTKNQPNILTKFRIFLFFFFYLTIVRDSPVDLTPKRFWAKPFVKDFRWIFKDGVFGVPQRINKWDFIPNDRSGYKKIAAYCLWKTVKWQNRLYHLSCVLPQIKLLLLFF